jgi:hypothetical protein
MIIGTIGFIGSGKGTVADILVEKKGFTKLAFADAVKDATAAIFGWPRALLEGDTEESRKFRETRDEWWSEKTGKHITPRYMLQIMGTEAGRDVFHPDLWILALEKKLGMYQNVVISDVRFPNEIEFIQRMGGFVVRVKRGEDPEWYEDALKANLECNSDLMVDHPIHYSEWAWIGYPVDYQLDNIGAISMLDGDIEHMIKIFTGPQKPAILAA